MSAASWHLGPLASYDCETSGLDTSNDRIVTAALIRPNGETMRWLSDADGVDIPTAASDIHKVTTEHARAHGRPAKLVVEEITDAIARELTLGGAALVVMNAPFDLGMLDAECTRHGLPSLADRIGRPIGPVIDPLVLDRAADRYRKGKRNLEALAAHYGVKLTGAHQADADARAALDVALRVAEKYPELQAPAEVVHRWQVVMHQRWAVGFQAHLRKTNPKASIEPAWPLIPAAAEGVSS